MSYCLWVQHLDIIWIHCFSTFALSLCCLSVFQSCFHPASRLWGDICSHLICLCANTHFRLDLSNVLVTMTWVASLTRTTSTYHKFKGLLCTKCLFFLYHEYSCFERRRFPNCVLNVFLFVPFPPSRFFLFIYFLTACFELHPQRCRFFSKTRSVSFFSSCDRRYREQS